MNACFWGCRSFSVLSRVQLFAIPWSYSPPDFSVNGIFQARILEWAAIPTPEDLPKPGIKAASPISPALVGRFFTTSTNFSQSVQSLSRVWLCNPMDCSTTGFPIHHQLLELAQTYVHRGGDPYQFHPISYNPESTTTSRKGTSSPPAIFPLTHR